MDPWWAKKGFRRLFDDIDKEPEDIIEMFQRMFKSFERIPEIGELEGSYFFGFSITQGREGKPVIREFGNVRPSGNSVIKSTVREPLVDTVYDSKHSLVKVIVELPGVDADNIRVVAQERAVTVKAANGDRLYETSVPLDVPIVRKMVKRTFNNGVLEVTFKEKAKPRRIDAKGGLGQQ